MPHSLRRVGSLVVALVGAYPLATAAPLKGVIEQPPLPREVPAALVQAAAEHRVPIEGFSAAGEPRHLTLGDEVTALVTLRERKGERQWLIHLRAAPPSAAEQKEHPPRDLTLTAVSGRVHHFPTGGGLALDTATFGPVGGGRAGQPTLQRARAFVSPDLLAIGLEESCRTNLDLTSRYPAPPPGTTAPPATLTEAEERAMLTFMPALMSFYDVVQNTPGLRDILWSLIEKPSAWSVVKRGGRVDTNLELGDNSVAPTGIPGWPGSTPPRYRMSFALSFNGHPALNCSLFVTAPVTPLLTTAGIVALVAEPPGRTDKHLEIRLVAARRGPE